MDIPFKLDLAGNIEQPTFVIEYRSGKRIGSILNVRELNFENSFGNASTFNFTVYKKHTPYYYAIKNFRLAWIPEWDKYYEIRVDINENKSKIKNVTLTHLPEAELSQINLYNIEINTDNDIARDDYVETVFYNSEDPKGSLIHRITEKAVNFTIKHIDNSLTKIFRTFTFNDISLYDAFKKIEEELNCIFIFDSYTDKDTGKIMRTISAYDLENWCSNPNCLYRSEYGMEVCPECGNTVINNGYGEDTTIFFSVDNVAEEIGYSTDVDSVKNCFRLEAGDDNMTAAIMNANPNGSQYIWYISEEMKEDMSNKLVLKINSYDELYKEYNDIYKYDVSYLSAINDLIEKYPNSKIGKKTTIIHSDGTEEIVYTGYDNIIGYTELINLHYDVLDMQYYLEHELMPSVDMSVIKTTTAKKEAAKLETANNWVGGIAVQNLKTKLQTDPNYLSTSSGKLAVELSIKKKAETIIDSRYSVDISTTSIQKVNSTSGKWTGKFIVKNESAPDDDYYPASGDTQKSITVNISGDYEVFIKQCIDIALKKLDTDDYSITGLFKLDYDDFVSELSKYGKVSLESFLNGCQTVLDILIEQGIGECNEYVDEETGEVRQRGTLFDDKDLYNEIYVPYSAKYDAIEKALNERSSELDRLTELQEEIEKIEYEVHNVLNFENHIKRDANGGLTDTELWSEFCSFRREDTYSNENYISDNLSNAEIFDNAKNFIEAAKKDIIKSATLQHSINSTVKNLIAIKEFEPLLDHFGIGNWLRIEVDEQIHKLRLLSYSINFDDYTNISVDFSDVMKAGANAYSDLQSALNNVKTMSTSYSSTKHQAEKASQTTQMVKGWVDDGLAATQMRIINDADNQTLVYDQHGVLIRQLDPITDAYNPCQMKIVHSTIAITDNNWQSTKTAIGRFYYYNPVENDDGTRDLIEAYGVNAETVIGKIILGEQLGIYNETNSLTFNKNGLCVTNNTVTFSLNPNNKNIVNISTTDENSISTNIFTITNSGNLSLSGIINATGGKISNWVIQSDRITSSNNVYIGGGGAGLMLINEENKPFIRAQNSDSKATFQVSREGLLIAEDATISGDINATSIVIKDNIYLKSGEFSDNKNRIFVSCDNSMKGDTFHIGDGTCGIYLNAYTQIDSLYCDAITCSSINSMKDILIKTSKGISITATNSASITASSYSIKTTGAITMNNGQCTVGMFKDETRFRVAMEYDSVVGLGSSSARWANVWAANGTVQTSDERDKTILGDIDDRYKQLFMSLKPILYKWKNERIDCKTHIGLGAQTTEKSAISCGIIPSEIGFIEHDYWDEPLKDGRVDRYGMNYQEIAVMTVPIVQQHETMMQQYEAQLTRHQETIESQNTEIKSLKNELQELKDVINNLTK